MMALMALSFVPAGKNSCCLMEGRVMTGFMGVDIDELTNGDACVLRTGCFEC
jgi:hypothetical protein